MNDENRGGRDSGTWEHVRGTRPKILRADYSRSVTCCAYHVACKQVVFHPLKGTMFWQVDDHAIRKLMDVPPLLQTLG